MKNNLKLLLLQKGKQAKELADYIGVNKVIMSYITNGVLMPTVEMTNKICKFLNCLVTDIWSEEQITYLKHHTSNKSNFNDKQQSIMLLNQNKGGYNLFNSQVVSNLKMFTATAGKEFYKPTNRLNKEGYALINPDKLREEGFVSSQHWFNWLLNNYKLWTELRAIEKKQAILANLPTNQITKGVNYGGN